MTGDKKKTEYRIGDVTLENPFILAPLAGITDVPFRRICKAMGAGLVYTEMVSAKGLYYRDKSTESLLKLYDDELPAAIQIFGSEPKIMASAAEYLESRKNSILDINMGCPVPKIVKNGEGSALLRQPKLAEEIVKEVVKATQKPVTVKIRIGWDENEVNAVEFAKRMEGAGASAIAVHGRTRMQFYSGKADWAEIAKVKSAVKIPVIGNGDIWSGIDALKMMQETGCDMVMIARGAMGNPWIFRSAIEGENQDITENEIISMALKHFSMLREEKGDYIAVRLMRKHAGWYIKGMHGAVEVRRAINQIGEPEKIMELLMTLTNKNISG